MQLEKNIEEVGSNTQDECLVPRVRQQDSKHEWAFISEYHEQYREIETIFNKHWNILCMDKTLSKVLPPRPPFIYRKTRSFGDQVVKKVLDPPSKIKMFWDRTGFFACSNCKASQQVSTHLRGLTNFTSTANVKEFQIQEFITCSEEK